MYLHLPFEIRDLVRRLPDKLSKKLDLSMVDEDDLKSMAKKLADILEVEGDPEIQYIYNGCLVLSDQFDVLLHHVFPPQNTTDLMWYWYAFKFIPDKTKQSKFNLHEEIQIPEDEIGALILPLIREFFRGKADFIKCAENLQKLIYEFPSFVADNVLLTCVTIRGFSDHLAMVPDRYDEIISPLEKFLIGQKCEFLLMIIKTDRGRIYFNNRQYTNSLQMFEEASAIAVKHDYNLIQLLLHRKAKIFRAMELFDEERSARFKLTELNPKEPRYEFSLSDYFAERGMYEEALNHLRKARSLYNFENLLFIDEVEHSILLKLQREKEAGEIYETVKKDIVEYDDDYSRYLWSLMAGRQKQYYGYFDEALEYFNEVFEFANNNDDLESMLLYYNLMIENQYDHYEADLFSITIKETLLRMVSTFLSLNEQYNMKKGQLLLHIMRSDLNKILGMDSDSKNDLKNAKIIGGELQIKSLDKLIEDRVSKIGTMPEYKEMIAEHRKLMKELLYLEANAEFDSAKQIIHGVLLLDKYGNSVFSHYFTDYLKSSSGLVSGLLSAFNSFLGNLVEGKGILQSIKHEDLFMMVEIAQSYLVVTIASDDSFIIREKTRILAKKLEKMIKIYYSSLKKATVPTEFLDKVSILIDEVF